MPRLFSRCRSLLLVAALPLLACHSDFHVEVRRTTAGVPHVLARDLGSLGYGYGYVFAEDNLCTLLEEVLTARGERAKYFGDVPYDLGNSGSRSNLKSDAVHRMLLPLSVADKYRATLDADEQAEVRGYAAGVSRYVRELKEGRHAGRHMRCRTEPWLRELTDEDIYLRVFRLNLLISSVQFVDGIAAAQPPAASSTPQHSQRSSGLDEIEAGLAQAAPTWQRVRAGEVGSNMYAFGKEQTTGGGIVFGNPHFPGYGGERLYQVHLTVPGVLDIQGASVYGMPIVNFGFKQTHAWSHTISYAHRFTPYALTLKPGDPLTYIQDGVEKKIEPLDVGVQVLRDGALQTENVRLYRSEYGPLVNFGSPALSWNEAHAISIRDANAENFRLLRQTFRWNKANSLDAFMRIQREELATPWVHTVAADREGNVYYADMSVVPNVPDALAARCAVPELSALVEAAFPRLPLLDGSRSECNWQIDPRAAQRGAMAAERLPSVRRADWVVNCNNSHWLNNTSAPLSGYDRIIGAEASAQPLRTRLCHQQVLDRIAGRDGFHGNKFSPEVVEQIVLGSRIYSAEREKPALLAQLCSEQSLTLSHDVLRGTVFEPPIDVPIERACAALAAWDDRVNLDSRGSLLWDEFWFRVEELQTRGTPIYRTPFDVNAPIDTPRDLDLASAAITEAFAAAVASVRAAGYAEDAPRSLFAYREGTSASDRIPVFGGYERTGAFTIAHAFSSSRGGKPNLQPGIGYGPMRYGNSYLQVVSYDKDGALRASTLLTYSLSTDPASPHYLDYTRRYVQKDWVRASFTEQEVLDDTHSSFVLSASEEPGARLSLANM